MLTDTILITGLILIIILVVPLVCKPLHIPAIVGLILTGLLIGPHGVGLLDRDATVSALSQIGILYVMFLSGIEIDINDFREERGRSVIFGLLAFFLPAVFGLLAGYAIHLSIWSSLLVASMIGSHTLMTYPVVSKYGIQRNPAVSIVIGATIFCVTAALIILAGVSSVFHADGQNIWLRMLIGSAVMLAVIFLLMPWLTKWFLHWCNDTVIQWSFVMALALIGGILAKASGLEPILGVFLTALAINRRIPKLSPLMNRISFVGNAILIPIFLLGVGMLIDLSVFVQGWETLEVTILMIVAAIGGKWLAAFLSQHIFRLNGFQRQLIFGLTNAHAAGALATVMIGYGIVMENGEHLIPESVLNATILLILVCCAISSFVTEHAAKHLAQEAAPADSSVDDDLMWLLPAVKTTANRRPKDLASLLQDGVRKMPAEWRAKVIVSGFSEMDNDASLSLLGKPEQAVWLCHLLQPVAEINRVRIITPANAAAEPYYQNWQSLLEQLVAGLRAEVTQETLTDWKVLPRVARGIDKDELLVVVQARPDTPSHSDDMALVPEILRTDFKEQNFLLIYPAQHLNEGAEASLLAEPTYGNAPVQGSFIRRMKERFRKR